MPPAKRKRTTTKQRVIESDDEHDAPPKKRPSLEPQHDADDGEQEQEQPQQPEQPEQPEPELPVQQPEPQQPEPQPTPEPPKGPLSRLVIHKITLINFKSYAGKQVIGPFHKSFSAIVGPNGSGKSNTIDALLFVFGYRASKMRQAKVSELIHNSANFPDLDECSVEIHFRDIIDLPGSDAYEVVPNSDLVVARYAYKNNGSKYTVNGRQNTYSQVQGLLKDKGIDLDHNRFLILQGEVESIAQMKPKGSTEHEDGLLEYLEDIIGTSQYKAPIDEAMQKLEDLQDARGEKMNRLRLVEKEKNSLEAKKKEAEDYLRLQNEHVRAESRLYQFYVWKCLENAEKFDAEILELEEKLQAEVDKYKDDIEHLDLMHKHYAQRQAAYDEVKAAAEEATKELKEHEKKAVKLEEEKKHHAGTVKKLKKTVTTDKTAHTDAERTIKDSTEKIETCQAQLEEYEQSLGVEEKELEKVTESLKGKTQQFHDQIEVKQRELQPWTAQIDDKQGALTIAEEERKTLHKKAEDALQQSEEASQQLSDLQSHHSSKIKEKDSLRTEKEKLQRDLKAATDRLGSAQENVKRARVKANSARQKVDEAKSSQAENRSQNRVLDGLTQLKRAGRVDGFHGRLGSLGTIPDKYDVAISTACGALNNMVVDTVEQGQTCITYLRNQNLGRASFMVLDKIGHQDTRPIPTPDNVPRLFDLITPKEPKFAPAFYKAISNTLVADNMDQANRIAFGGVDGRRWRVVTLTGQLIDISGTMSGGGTQPARGGMSSKFAADTVSPETLAKYEAESTQAQKALAEAVQEEKNAEGDLERLRARGPEIDVQFQKLGMEIETGKRQITEVEKRVKDLQAATKPDVGDLKRIKTLDRDIETWSSELKDLQESTSKIQKAIKALEDKILEIGGTKLLAQKSKVDSLRTHITVTTDNITRHEVAKTKAEKDVRKLSKSIKDNSEALKAAEEELATRTEKLAEVQQWVDELKERVDEAKAAEENSKDDLSSLKKDLDKKEDEVNKFRQKELELKQKVEDKKKERQEVDGQLQHWQDKHDNLKLEEVDEEEEDEDEEAGEGAASSEAGEKVKPDPEEHKQPTTELITYNTDQLSRFKKRELLADVELLAEKLQRAKPNLSVLAEYRKKEEDFLNRAKELDDVTKERDEMKATYDGLRKRRLDEFMTGFGVIGLRLKEMYQMITLGGNAELELVDSMDPFSEGIIFSVMPPKKSWKNISNLSGGEKTLSSLALVFALHAFKPTPLYFMDEIDAALDFRNVSIVANYIKDRTKNAQFIIISLRNDMFELSQRLIGIYKTSNTTKSISINNTNIKAGLGVNVRQPQAVAA